MWNSSAGAAGSRPRSKQRTAGGNRIHDSSAPPRSAPAGGSAAGSLLRARRAESRRGPVHAPARSEKRKRGRRSHRRDSRRRDPGPQFRSAGRNALADALLLRRTGQTLPSPGFRAPHAAVRSGEPTDRGAGFGQPQALAAGDARQRQDLETAEDGKEDRKST